MLEGLLWLIDYGRLMGDPDFSLLWVTCGNTTNQRLQALFTEVFPQALQLLDEGHVVVELADKS